MSERDFLYPQVLEGEAHAGCHMAGVPRGQERMRTCGQVPLLGGRVEYSNTRLKA